MCKFVISYKLLNCNCVLLVIATQNTHKSIATDSGYANEASVGTTGTPYRFLGTDPTRLPDKSFY